MAHNTLERCLQCFFFKLLTVFSQWRKYMMTNYNIIVFILYIYQWLDWSHCVFFFSS